jgi:MerR-like DNA binding protein
MAGKRYTTVQVAREAKVPRATLQFWISSGKIDAPAVQLVDGRAVRFWTVADLDKVRKLKGSLKKGPKPKKK